MIAHVQTRRNTNKRAQTDTQSMPASFNEKSSLFMRLCLDFIWAISKTFHDVWGQRKRQKSERYKCINEFKHTHN